MSNATPAVLRLGTRGSLLARTQSEMVAQSLRALHPGLRVELIEIRTSGDRITDKPLYEFGGKGLFTKELEQALLSGSIDFAVHSFKDVPVTMPLVDQADLIIAAVPVREDPRDVLVSMKASSIPDLPTGARVGTGSLRRRAQLLNLRPDLVIEPVRGNIDTRLRKCREGRYDAIVLAAAGVKRAGLFDPVVMSFLDPSESLPAPAQGALALQCRKSDARCRELLQAMNDRLTESCVIAERHLVQLLRGDCHSPIGALGEVREDGLHLRGAVAGRGGELPVLTARATGRTDDPLRAANQVFDALTAAGAMDLLHNDRPQKA
jgi:hydroxymethylbilane synthase